MRNERTEARGTDTAAEQLSWSSWRHCNRVCCHAGHNDERRACGGERAGEMMVGLTSSSSAEVMKGCPKQAEGMIIPTSFAPITAAAKEVAALAAANGGSADLHSAASWENVMIIKDVIEAVGITGDPSKVKEERAKIRDGLEALETTEGLIGKVTRVQDEGEALKPFVFVHAKNGNWEVLHDPRK